MIATLHKSTVPVSNPGQDLAISTHAHTNTLRLPCDEAVADSQQLPPCHRFIHHCAGSFRTPIQLIYKYALGYRYYISYS